MSEWLAESWVTVTLVFVAGTLAASFAAARYWPSRPYRAALLGGLAFETALLLTLRPGVSAMALLIAVTCTTLLALIGGWLGRRSVAQA